MYRRRLGVYGAFHGRRWVGNMRLCAASATKYRDGTLRHDGAGKARMGRSRLTAICAQQYYLQ